MCIKFPPLHYFSLFSLILDVALRKLVTINKELEIEEILETLFINPSFESHTKNCIVIYCLKIFIMIHVFNSVQFPLIFLKQIIENPRITKEPVT